MEDITKLSDTELLNKWRYEKNTYCILDTEKAIRIYELEHEMDRRKEVIV